MEDVRWQILQLLQSGTAETVEQLLRALGLAPATVRRHLDILQRDGLVTYRLVRKKAGRPEYSYYLTEAGQESLPKDYHRLLGLLVQEMDSVAPPDGPDDAPQSLAEHLFSRISHRVAQPHQEDLNGASFPERILHIVETLRHQHFSPELEESTDGQTVRIRLLNCPFRTVALESSAVCAYDHQLIAELSGASVTQEQCIRDGAQTCCYLVSPPEPPPPASPL